MFSMRSTLPLSLFLLACALVLTFQDSVHSMDQQQNGCTVGCEASAPPTGLVNNEVAFSGSATTSGCAAGEPLYEWDFGDNTGSKEQNPTHVYTQGGTYNWRLTVKATGPISMSLASTVAGSGGEGNPAREIGFARLTTAARDPLGRGLYVVSVQHTLEASTVNLIRFINTSAETVTLGGKDIAPGTVRVIAGGGNLTGDDVPALSTDLSTVSGLAVNADGSILYYTEQSGQRVRAINVSSEPVSIAGAMVDPGRVRTLAAPMTPEGPLFGDFLYGLAYNPATGRVAVADATPGIDRVYEIDANGTVMHVAGNGAMSRFDEMFMPGPALEIPLLDPRGVEYDSGGNLIIADTGHSRLIRVAASGGATLVRQFNTGRGSDAAFPAGVAVRGADIYSANGNEHRIVRATGGEVTVAGQFGELCEMVSNNCGDGGPATEAGLFLATTNFDVALIGLEGDANGLYLLDQTPNQRARVRYINLSATPVTLAGVTINPGAIATIAGSGRPWPYDGGLATSGTLRGPSGVAADADGNIYLTDPTSGRVRFVNRTSSSITLFPGLLSQQVVPPGAIVTLNHQGGGSSTDIVPIHLASFQHPAGMTISENGIFIADERAGPFVPPGFGGRITGLLRFVNTTSEPVTFFPFAENPITVPPGFVATIAGGGDEQIVGNGDGGFALSAKFFGMSDVAIADDGDIYIAETGQGAVRKIDAASGHVSSLNLPVSQYTGLGIGPDGRLFIVDAEGSQLLREDNPGSETFTTLAMNLGSPRDVAVDPEGVALVTSAETSQILAVAPNGSVTTFAGSTPGFGGDDGPAASAQFNLAVPPLNIGTAAAQSLVPQTIGIAVTATREIFIADTLNLRIRRLGAPIITCVKTGTITISNPVPVLSTLAPGTGSVGGTGFTLTLNGTNFVANSVVRWNGNARSTSFVSPTQLTAQILESDLMAPGMAQVSVFNPEPGGGLSGVVGFSIVYPLPKPVNLVPLSTIVGGGAFTLTVEGTDFVSNSIVRWNGSDRPTTFISRTQLTAQIPAGDITQAGTANITVFNPAPGGGTSTPLVFSINNPLPAITSLDPPATPAAGPAFTLTVNGTNFVAGSTVRWNGSNRQTTFVSNTQLRADIPASDILSSTAVEVAVFNPAPGGGLSAAATFTVTNPVPSLASLTPSSAIAGGGSFTLTLSGMRFIPGAEVFWGDEKRPTTLIDGQTLRAEIPASDIAMAGVVPVTVVNPSPGGGTSNAIDFTINNPVPALTGLDPERIVAGSADIALTVTGANFTGNSVIRVNGQDRATTFLSATMLRTVLGGGDLASVGQIAITVFTPGPGGGSSAPLNLEIFPPNPSPMVTGISPQTAVEGTAGVQITVTGSGFIPLSEVHWNGAKRETIFVSASELKANLTQADLAQAGTGMVSVFTPQPGGGTSNSVEFVIAGRLAIVSAASFAPIAVAAESIVAAFGARLAVGTQVANTVPLPMLLLGTSVQVIDVQGTSRQASLFFVAPGQINFQIPPGTSTGQATVKITSGDGSVSQGVVQITEISLGIFTANSDGVGVAAANILRVKTDGGQSFEDTAQLEPGGQRFIARCIDLGPQGEQVFLILYGTGVKAISDLSTMRVTIGNMNVPVLFAGAQGGFVGLDQINLGPIPRELLGAGTVDVVLSINDQPVNTVQICIQ